ncbi:MAG TPA: SCP2 sterol-binding domain-containing protein [Nevskiaceae bacterium]|nr:SCP2 sterol-binding domain-containing protein [Nevskiaceae bacterium]
MTPPLLCAGLEIALNRTLALEPAVLAQCQRLSGRRIELCAETLGWTLSLEFHAAGVRVLPVAEGEPDVRLRGSPAELIGLGLRQLRGEPSLGGLRVEGDVELLQRFQRMLAEARLDPEEWLAPLIGDTPAHRLAQGLRGLFGWGRQSLSTLGLDTAEYLREETRDLARAADVEDWMQAVETLREDADRLEARLRRLEQARA